jgi:diguanylate cyclase
LTDRKRFDQALKLEISEAEETGDPLSLLLLDIDHFKNFNDPYGHQTGDQALKLVAYTLKKNLKGRDCAARRRRICDHPTEDKTCGCDTAD